MKKLLLLVLVTSIPFGVFATDATTDTDIVLNQTKSVLDQYANRIKTLEAENKLLREEMAKAGIKIPLTIFTGAINGTGTNTMIATGGVTTVSNSTGLTTPPTTSTPETTIDTTALYGERYGGFIKKAQNDWAGIVSAYKINTGAYIGGFEFVKLGNDNHAFIDIVYDPKAGTGIYDAKILYEYNTDTFQRKLIGFFEFDRAKGFYKTKTGTNPYAGVQRTFIANPYIRSASSVTVTSSNTGTTSVMASGSAVTIANIEKAYSDKRYLSVISLSNSYLTVNPATVDILRIRYRTYFIIGKYTESLTEIGKIEDLQLGKLDKAVACDAQVIATYSSNNTLIDKYTKLCAKK